MKSDRDILELIIEDKRKELLLSKIQNTLYAREYVDPRKIGKYEAEEKMGIYQKHIKHLEDQLIVLEKYGKNL